MSDHGPEERAYREAIDAFAQKAGIDGLEIREPEVTGFVSFGLEAPIAGHGLAGLFPPDLTGYYDGAEVSVPVALELVRAMLRDHGTWCRLEQRDTFTVVGLKWPNPTERPSVGRCHAPPITSVT
ncbi:hypothetical protein ACFVX6_19120 [Streptomyces sp. NPDC058289]|uniref:hypothetical protein n=1 Tax=Streptomyces sp. NPDC058289 TaxID=3346425 RepID=UPI0036EE2D97